MKIIVKELRNWLRRSNERYMLTQLNEWQLRDIGLSRELVSSEATKPFWRS